MNEDALQEKQEFEDEIIPDKAAEEESGEYALKVADKISEEEIMDAISQAAKQDNEEEVLDTSTETPAVEETKEQQQQKLALELKMKNLSIMYGVRRHETPAHNPEKKHGNLSEKKNAKSREKKARKTEKNSRRKNRGKK